MMTVKDVCRMTGVSARTLRYYDSIGLLTPTAVTDAGYRQYDTASLHRLGEILLLRELEFSLGEIRGILDENYNREKVIDTQIELLNMKKQKLDELIVFAGKIRNGECEEMNFEVFDKKKMEKYAKEAREKWGSTEVYREYEQKSKGRTYDAERAVSDGLLDIFALFGDAKNEAPESDAAQKLVQKLREYITENYYTCTKEILSSLGRMYAAGGEMTDNIDAAGGEGTAAFAASAIEVYCK